MFKNKNFLTLYLVAAACFSVSSCTGVSNPNPNAKIPAGGGQQPVPAQPQMVPNPVETITPVPPSQVGSVPQNLGQANDVGAQAVPQAQASMESADLNCVNASGVDEKDYDVKGMAPALPVNVKGSGLVGTHIATTTFGNVYVPDSLTAYVATFKINRFKTIFCSPVGARVVVGILGSDGSWKLVDEKYGYSVQPSSPPVSHYDRNVTSDVTCADGALEVSRVITSTSEVAPLVKVKDTNITARYMALGDGNVTFIPEELYGHVQSEIANQRYRMSLMVLSCAPNTNVATGVLSNGQWILLQNNQR